MGKQLVALENAGLSRKQRRQLQKTYQQAVTEEQHAQEKFELLPVLQPFARFREDFFTFNIRLPWHRATGWQLAAANTFAANDSWDSAGPVIGIDLNSGRAFTFDPWQLYLQGLVSSPNLLIQGSLRQGKSFLVKRLITSLTQFGRQAINTSDSKGEHGELALELGGQVFKMGEHNSPIRINPLEAPEKQLHETEHVYQARVRSSRLSILTQIVSLLNPDSRSVSSKEMRILEWALDISAVNTGNKPTIRAVWDCLNNPKLFTETGASFSAADAENISDGLRRLVSGDLAGMFDTESTVKLNPESVYTVIDTFNLAQRSELALAVTQAVTNHWVLATISNKNAGRNYFLIREEGWADMRTVPALEAHQRQLKLSGEFGVAMVLIVHEAGDFDAVGAEGSKERELAKGLLKGYANKISFYQNKQTLLEAVDRGIFTSSEAAAIGLLERGQFLLKTRSASFVIDGGPVTTEWEKRVFDTDKQMRAKQAEGGAE